MELSHSKATYKQAIIFIYEIGITNTFLQTCVFFYTEAAFKLLFIQDNLQQE